MNSDCEAEAILAQLRAGNVPEGVAAEGNRYLYEQKKITKDTLLNYCDNPEAVQKRIYWKAACFRAFLKAENLIHDFFFVLIVCREYTCLNRLGSVRHEESEEILWRKRVLNFLKNMRLR